MTECSHSQTIKENINSSSGNRFQLRLECGLHLVTKLQQKHTLTISCSKSLLLNKYTNSDWKLNIPKVTINKEGLMQQGDLIRFDDLMIMRTTGAHELAKQYRSDIDGLVLEVNPQSLIISVAVVEFSFPHEIDVHDLFTAEFLAVFKWLKILHVGNDNADSLMQQKLHPDIMIFVKHVCVEFQDDAFEVQLRCVPINA